MAPKPGRVRSWCGIAAIAGALLLAAPFAPAARAAEAYSFGVVPQFEPRRLFSIWQPVLAELERRTGLTFHMVGSPKFPAFEKSFLNGEFDFAYMNPYHALLAMRRQGYQPLVRAGDGALSGVLVVRKDSPIRDVRDLMDREIAFPAANAFVASLLIRAELARVHALRIKPVFVQNHSSVYLHVSLGLVSAGGGAVTTLEAQPPELRDSLRILHRTREMAPHPITVHPRVPVAHREMVRRAFLEMGATQEGAALLAAVPLRSVKVAAASDYAELADWGLEKFHLEQN